MTRDDFMRMAQEAGLGEHATAVFLERFANLVIENFLTKNCQYVTNDASREAEINAARREGWFSAQEAAACICEYRAYALDFGGNRYLREEASNKCAIGIRAMQPPDEWASSEQ